MPFGVLTQGTRVLDGVEILPQEGIHAAARQELSITRDCDRHYFLISSST